MGVTSTTASANTYVPIETNTLITNAASITFSSIASGYTDLVIVANIIGNATASNYYQINGDTATNYSATFLSGNGSTATSTRYSTQNVGFIDNVATSGTTNPNYNVIINFQNYSNTTTNKTTLSRANNAATGTDAVVGLWRSTAAITSITILPSASSYASGSTFTLYGIKAA